MGEGQAIEFKLELPAQPHDIAKSIAAFASSNDGLLIYGVSDDGRIVGLAEASDPKWRDRTQQQSPTCVYVVRSKSDVGESFIVVQADDVKVWLLPDVWHVSDHVGGGGSRDLLSLCDLFRRWATVSKSYSVLGRLIDPRLARSIHDGAAYPGVVEYLPLSHWWDDLTDLGSDRRQRNRIGGAMVD
jgi:hypothetical protein